MSSLKIARLVQQGSLAVLLFLLPFSSAAVEISFFLLLFGWLAERLVLGWEALTAQPGRRGPVELLRAAWHTSVWAQGPMRWCARTTWLFLVVGAMTIPISSYPDHSLIGFICKTLEYTLFMIMAADVARDPAIARRALVILMVSALVVGVDGVLQEFLGKDPLRGHKLLIYLRMTGPYQNPADLACYLIVVLPVVLAWLSMGQRRGRGGVVLLALLLLGCLVRVESQGAWLGFLAGVAAMVWLIRERRRTMLTFGVLFLLIGVWWLQREGRLSAVAGFSDVGVKDRVVVWTAAWRMFTARPILGHGLNTFMANYLTYWVGGERQPRYAHNCYLQTAAETGIIGLASFLWLLAALFQRLGAGARQRSDGPRLMLIGLIAGLVAFAVQAAVDTNFYSLRQAALFWVLMGVALGIASWLPAPATPKPMPEERAFAVCPRV